MTAPAHVLAAVRSIPHPRQETDMTTIDRTGASDAEFQARIAPFTLVPDPRFRDKLVRRLAEHEGNPPPPFNAEVEAVIDLLMPAITAEVEARVQAADNQREAETLIRLADAWDENASRWYYEHRHTHPNGIGWVGGFEEGWGEGARLLRDRAAALASPAPAPQTGEH